MSVSQFHFSGKRRAVAAVLAAVTLVAVVTTVLFMSFHTKTAFGAGAGLCTPNTPVCTERGGSAMATFDNVSTDGCILTQVSANPTTSLSQPGNNGSQSVFLFISKYDQCNNVQIEEGTNDNPANGETPFTGTIDFGPNLSTGSLNGTAPIYDLNSGELLYTATINVTWQGYGSTTTRLDNEHFFSQNVVMNLNIHGTSRNAEASGTFTDETGSNVITGPTLNAELFDGNGTQVMIFKS